MHKIVMLSFVLVLLLGTLSPVFAQQSTRQASQEEKAEVRRRVEALRARAGAGNGDVVPVAQNIADKPVATTARAMDAETTELEAKAMCQSLPGNCLDGMPKPVSAETYSSISNHSQAKIYEGAAFDESQKREKEAAQKDSFEREMKRYARQAEHERDMLKSRCKWEGTTAGFIVGYRKRGLSLIEALQEIRGLDPNDELLRVRLMAPRIYASQMTEEQAGKEVEAHCLMTASKLEY